MVKNCHKYFNVKNYKTETQRYKETKRFCEKILQAQKVQNAHKQTKTKKAAF